MDQLLIVRFAESLELPWFSVDTQSALKEKSERRSRESVFKGTVIDFDEMYLVIGGDEFDY